MKDSFLGLIKNSIHSNWNLPALTDIGATTYCYKDFAAEMARLHLLFQSVGIAKGDKVAICGRNSSHWAIAFFGITSYGACATTILPDFSAENIHNIMNHAECKALFTDPQIWERIDSTQMPLIETYISLADFSILHSKSNHVKEVADNMEDLFKKKYPNGFTKEDTYFHAEHPDELAVLNYTSGTTSSPKGVMLPYRSLWSNAKYGIDKIPYAVCGENMVCILPMAHMLGLSYEIFLGISQGVHINFMMRVPSPQVIIETFAALKPSLIFLVPLIIEKVVKNIILPSLKGKMPETDEEKKAIRDKIINLFGGNVKEIGIGGAALSHESGDLLTLVGFPYTVGYGMTECGPLITYSDWSTYQPGSCGRVIDRMEIKLDSPDPANIVGELYTRGTNVMLGYYKNKDATDEILSKDGWLKTGDLALMDKGGNVFIKGRSKTMLLSASGQNIYPEEIEFVLNNSPLIAESLIVQRNNNLVALILPNMEYFNQENVSGERIEGMLAEEIKVLNNRLPAYCCISKIEIREQEFEKTPKRSIRRFLYQ